MTRPTSVTPARRASATAAAALLFSLLTVVGAGADGAVIDKTGWWNRANEGVSSPAGPVAVPPPPGVPAGDLVVSAGSGDATAVLAVGIQPEDDPGATVERFTMTIREDPDAEGNQGTEAAAIVACPIVDFWAGGENSEWSTRPTTDCELAQVAGERDDDGVWVFDLAPIGRAWFDPFSGVRADGVVLMEAVDAPASFQAVFLGADDITIVLETEPAPDAEEDPFTFDDPPSDAGLNSGPSGGGGSLFSPPVVTAPPTTRAPSTVSPVAPSPITPGDPSVTDDAAAGDDEIVAPPIAAEPVSVIDRSGDVFGNFPGGVVLLVPLVLAVLAAMSYWLGPAGQPVTESRQRGVSRALDARARANSRSSA